MVETPNERAPVMAAAPQAASDSRLDARDLDCIGGTSYMSCGDFLGRATAGPCESWNVRDSI
jgi:hypothetical protein